MEYNAYSVEVKYDQKTSVVREGAGYKTSIAWLIFENVIILKKNGQN